MPAIQLQWLQTLSIVCTNTTILIKCINYHMTSFPLRMLLINRSSANNYLWTENLKGSVQNLHIRNDPSFHSCSRRRDSLASVDWVRCAPGCHHSGGICSTTHSISIATHYMNSVPLKKIHSLLECGNARFIKGHTFFQGSGFKMNNGLLRLHKG